jgi:hypothetical protein
MADGKDLTVEEIKTLPVYQRRALEKSLQPLPRGTPKKVKRRAEKMPVILQPIKRSKLLGTRLSNQVLELSGQGWAEINVAIKCGYTSDEVGPFRTQLACAVGCKIGTMGRILAIHVAQLKRESPLSDLDVK